MPFEAKGRFLWCTPIVNELLKNAVWSISVWIFIWVQNYRLDKYHY